MSPRNRIRAVVASLGIVLIVHGTVEFFGARDADAASCTVGSTGPGCTTVRVPEGVSQAPLAEPGP